ncbi:MULTISPECIES: DUF4280 domain-containing protein [unclassified Myroides]|uniref:DUF4280 domain-containing protein n=1 Tax=unclassified Myroides TaxID=2642485 RepID=UPI003D2F7D78
MKEKTAEPTSILVAAVTQSFSDLVVCSGATCMCTGNPTIFASLSITTHQKYYLNAVDKLIATVEDTQFESGSSPFQQCKHKKGRDKTCVYQPSGNWEMDAKESVHTIDGRGILTKTGTLRCGKGGVLSIQTTGQVDGMEDVHKLEKEQAFSKGKTTRVKRVDFRSYPAQATSYVSQVEELTLCNLEQLHWGSLMRDNPRALRILKGDELIFTAATRGKEESKNITWSVLYAREGSRVLEVGKTGKTIVLHAVGEGYQTYSTKHRAFSWQPQSAGVYLIGVSPSPQLGVSKTYEENFYYYLEVVEDATITSLQLSVTPEEKMVVGDRVGITLHSDIKLTTRQKEQLRIKVSAKDVHPGNHTAYIFTSKGKDSFKQRGTAVQVIFDCVNVNSYQVEVYKNLVRQTAIPTPEFTVECSDLLTVLPPVESVRIGSRLVLAAEFKNGANINPLLVQWRIKMPDSEVFQEHFIKDRTMSLSFSRPGEYVIECVYDRLGVQRQRFRRTIRAVANTLEELIVLPCISVESPKDNKFKISGKDRVKVILGTTIGYQPPTVEPAYVEVQTNEESSSFTRIIQRTLSPLEKKSIRPRQLSTDTAIVWTLRYIKGAKKKVGFGLSIYYETPKPTKAAQGSVKQGILKQVAPTVAVVAPLSIYSIYTQTGCIVLRSNSAQFDFQFEEVGVYQLDVAFNQITKSYEIECVE